MALRSNPNLTQRNLKSGFNKNLKVSNKKGKQVFQGSKRKVNTYPEDNPDNFDKPFQRFLEDKDIKNFETYQRLFNEYMRDTNVSKAQMQGKKLLPLWKLHKTFLVKKLQEGNDISKNRATVMFNSFLARKPTKYQMAVQQGLIIRGVYLSKFTVKGKTRKVYRNKKGQFAKAPKEFKE